MAQFLKTKNRYGVWAMRAGFLLLVGLVSLEICVRLFFYDAIFRDNDCVVYAAESDPPATPRRFFRPNCRTRVESYDGTDFEISTNEDGLRDRPRDEFRDGAIALLGDSHAEGFTFDVQYSVGRRLEALSGGKLGAKIANMGFRGTGALEQLAIFRWVHPHYNVKGVIWILNENDILDDFFTDRRRLASGFMGELTRYVRILSGSVFGRRIYTLEWLRVLTHSFAMKLAVEAKYDSSGAADRVCKTVKDILGDLPAKTPVWLVAIPHGDPREHIAYFGMQIDHEGFGRTIECVGQSRIRVLDERKFFSGMSRFFIPDRYHLNKEGTEIWAARILSDMGLKP